MKKLLLAIFCLSFFLAGSSFATEPFEFYFEPSPQPLAWSNPDPAVKLEAGAGELKISSKAPFPYIISPPLYCLADEYDTLVIRMQASKSGTGAVFWATNFDPQFNQQKLLAFKLGTPNLPHTYYFNLKARHPAWQSQILRLAISPFNGEGNAQILYIKLKKADFSDKLAAGWQEFWDDKGRTVIGSTINGIAASMFNGRPINYYFYWILGWAALLLIGISSYKARGIKIFNKQSLVPLIIVLLALWGMSEANNLANQANQLKLDVSTYGGKTIEQKYSTALGDEQLYKFLKYCESMVPAGATYNLKTSLFMDPKFAYYFFPRIPSDQSPEYILTYKYAQPVEPHYKLWQSFGAEGKIYKL